jgi:hypothetical protein
MAALDSLWRFIFTSGRLIFVRTTAPNGWLRLDTYSIKAFWRLSAKFAWPYLGHRGYTGTNHTTRTSRFWSSTRRTTANCQPLFHFDHMSAYDTRDAIARTGNCTEINMSERRSVAALEFLSVDPQYKYSAVSNFCFCRTLSPILSPASHRHHGRSSFPVHQRRASPSCIWSYSTFY